MSILSRVVIANEIATYLPDNTTREINEQDVRDRMTNQNDSSFHVLDGLGFGEYDNGTTYNPDDFVTSGKVVYKKINISESGVAPPNAVSWEPQGSDIFMSEAQVGVTRVATQVEVNTGANDYYAVTPLKLATNLPIFYASQKASQAEVDAGVNDVKYVTPLKLATNLPIFYASQKASQVEVDEGIDNTKYVTALTLNNYTPADLAELRELTGTPTLDTDLGTFDNSIIGDSFTIKQALQALEDELAIPENRIPFGAPGGAGLITDADLQFDGSNLTLGSDPNLFDASARNTFAIQSSVAPSAIPVDTFALYTKDYRTLAGQASPFALTEDGYEINFRASSQDVFKFVNETNIDSADEQLVAGIGAFEEDFTTSNSIDSSTLTFDVALMPVAAGDPIVYENKTTIGGVDPNTSVNAWIAANISGDRFSDDTFFIRPTYNFRAGDENKKGIILLRYNYL